MAKRLSVQAVLGKWVRNAGSQQAQDSYKAGIASVTEAPGAKAAAAVDKYEAGVMRAVETGKFAQRVGSVTLADWKASAEANAGKLKDGVKKGERKMQSFLTEYLPFVSGVSAEIQSMPSTTEDDREARMLANVRRLRQFRRSK